MNAIHVYPVTRARPHVLSEDCWCEPTVEHVAASSEPQPLPAPPPDEQPEDPDNDDAGDEPVEGDQDA